MYRLPLEQRREDQPLLVELLQFNFLVNPRLKKLQRSLLLHRSQQVRPKPSEPGQPNGLLQF